MANVAIPKPVWTLETYSEATLKAYINSLTPGKADGQVNCALCNWSFIKPCDARRHVKLIHLREQGLNKAWGCPECKYQSGAKHQVESHINSFHYGIHVHKCSVCGSDFADSSSRRRHERTQHDIIINRRGTRPETEALRQVSPSRVVPARVSTNHVSASRVPRRRRPGSNSPRTNTRSTSVPEQPTDLLPLAMSSQASDPAHVSDPNALSLDASNNDPPAAPQLSQAPDPDYVPAASIPGSNAFIHGYEVVPDPNVFDMAGLVSYNQENPSHQPFVNGEAFNTSGFGMAEPTNSNGEGSSNQSFNNEQAFNTADFNMTGFMNSNGEGFSNEAINNEPQYAYPVYDQNHGFYQPNIPVEQQQYSFPYPALPVDQQLYAVEQQNAPAWQEQENMPNVGEQSTAPVRSSYDLNDFENIEMPPSAFANIDPSLLEGGFFNNIFNDAQYYTFNE